MRKGCRWDSWRLSVVAAVSLLVCSGGCRKGVGQPGTADNPIAQWRRVAIGRSDLMVPAGAVVAMRGEVNEVGLLTMPMPDGKTLDALWTARMAEIDAGAGVQDGHTLVRKRYPGLRQVYYEVGKDPEMLVKLERWVQIGSTLVEGVTDFNAKYLAAVEQNMDRLFTRARLGGTPGAGDFVINNVIFAVPLDGAESVSATITFDVGARAPASESHASVTVSEEVLSSPGNMTVLSRIAEATHNREGAQVKLVRSGKKKAGGMAGEESLLAFEPDGPRGAFRAEWETGGVANEVKAPETDVSLVAESKGRQDIALLRGCWDYLLASLSFR